MAAVVVVGEVAGDAGGAGGHIADCAPGDTTIARNQ